MNNTFKSKLSAYVKWIGGSMLSFILIYGSCNYLASTSLHRYKIYHPLELNIPFVPWMVIPYRCLDIILVIVLFLLSEARIKKYGFHMMLSLIPAGLVFVFFPGDCGYVRPNPESLGYFKGVFSVLYSLDKPHNLFPSLHVTYSYLGIRALTEEQASPALRAAYWMFFALISASIIFTWQHHLFDLFSGLLLGIVIYNIEIEDVKRLLIKVRA